MGSIFTEKRPWKSDDTPLQSLDDYLETEGTRHENKHNKQ
jgi:hypothetical protein